MTYIATFYSHFGAIRFKKQCEQAKLPARLMPVPRNLSSSCGTCIRYEGDNPSPAGEWSEDVEQVVAVEGEDYRVIYRAENS